MHSVFPKISKFNINDLNSNACQFKIIKTDRKCAVSTVRMLSIGSGMHELILTVEETPDELSFVEARIATMNNRALTAEPAMESRVTLEAASGTLSGNGDGRNGPSAS